MAVDEQTIYTAIADPTRRDIMQMLSHGPLPVHALADEFTVSRPAISKHLRILKEAGLVRESRRGRERLYRTRPEPLRRVQSWLDGFWKSRLEALKDLVE